MNPFSATQDGALYPASNYARSAIPNPQNPGNGSNNGAAAPAMSTAKRKQIAVIAAVFIVVAVVVFHWHFNRG